MFRVLPLLLAVACAHIEPQAPRSQYEFCEGHNCYPMPAQPDHASVLQAAYFPRAVPKTLLGAGMDVRSSASATSTPTFTGTNGFVGATILPTGSCLGFGALIGESCSNSTAWTIGGTATTFDIYYGNQLRLQNNVATGAWTSSFKISSGANFTIGTTGPGMYSGATAGIGTGGGLAFQGTATDAANAVASWEANANALTSGHDRYIKKFSNDNFSTLKAFITSAGSIGYEGSVQDGMFDREVASDVTNATTSFVDITGLTWAAVANTTYRFDCYLMYSTSVITTGIRVAINGPASPTLVDMSIEYGGVTVGNAAATSASFYQAAHLVAYDTGVATTDAVVISTAYPIVVHGLVRNGANAGTLAMRFASETANTTTILARSYCTIH